MLRPDRILAVPGTSALVKVGTVAAAVPVTALGNYSPVGWQMGSRCREAGCLVVTLDLDGKTH